LIRHAFFPVTSAVLPLTIAMIRSAFGSSLMFAIGLTALLPAGFLAATITAIAVPTITTATDIKNRGTANSNTKALPKHNTSVSAHPHPITGWTSTPLS